MKIDSRAAGPAEGAGSPPHNDEAEKAVLGAIRLYTDPEAIAEVFNILKEEDFYRERNKVIYKALYRLFHRKDSVNDIITLRDELKTLGELDKIDPAYLASLTTGVPGSANSSYYANIVLECSTRRKLLNTSAEITSNAYDETKNIDSVLAFAAKDIAAIADGQPSIGFVSAGELVVDTIKIIEVFYHNRGKYTGIPSGYDDLDNLLSGFQKSELIIIGARPSVGKTALALCMAANIAGISRKGTEKHAVGFFSLEMSQMLIMQRILACQARINAHLVRTGMLQPSDFNSMVDAASRISESELYISDAPNMELNDLRREARRMRRQKNIEIIFIDYIGLIRWAGAEPRKNVQRWEQFSEISMSLKALARELDIPIVAMSQLGRQVEKQAGPPTMADLRESGSLEQDADVIMLLDREQDRERKKRKSDEEETEKRVPSNNEILILDVVKQRNGPTGIVKLNLIKSQMRFESFTEKTDNKYR